MVEGWIITIISENDKGKIERTSFMEYGGIMNCTRIIHSFNPKRGYKPVRFEIERGVGLV